MSSLKPRHAAWLIGIAAWAAQAESSASSAVSDSVSTSVGSISTSVRKSSDSSSRGKDVAAGDYTVVEVAAADGKPGLLRLTLKAAAPASDDAPWTLDLPQAAAERGGIAAGVVVSARQRPYGLEFVAAATQQAFFLVLQDEWYRELNSRAVTL